MQKKYQVFISSTYEDLREERKKVQDTILSMCQFPIGMELFSAGDDEQWEVIKESIDTSDYYVLIIAHRYGSIINKGEDAGVSYTEKEYRYAKSKGVPILAFIIDENVPVLRAHVEADNKKSKKLQAFINEVKTGRVVKWWKSKEELAILVMNALNNEIIKGKRPGWVRADSFNIEENQKELIEMLKRVRRLEEENEELKRKIVIREPKLFVDINGKTSIEIPFVEKNLDYIDYDYLPLDTSDIPQNMQDKITIEEIDRYNKSLPSREALEDYKANLNFYYRAKDRAESIVFTVHNNGSLKARDIHIELIFPNEIKVYDKKALDEIKIPEELPKEINPLDKCYTSMFGGLNGMYEAFQREKYLMKEPSLAKIKLYDLAITKFETEHFYNKDNSISIRLDDLINGYTWSIKKEYFIVPLKKGVFAIECSIVCEEYSETKKQLIQVIVR